MSRINAATTFTQIQQQNLDHDENELLRYRGEVLFTRSDAETPVDWDVLPRQQRSATCNAAVMIIGHTIDCEYGPGTAERVFASVLQENNRNLNAGIRVSDLALIQEHLDKLPNSSPDDKGGDGGGLSPQLHGSHRSAGAPSPAPVQQLHFIQNHAIGLLQQQNVANDRINDMLKLGVLDDVSMLQDMIDGAATPELFASTLVENLNTAQASVLANHAQRALQSHLDRQHPPLLRQEINPDGNCFQAAVLVQMTQVDGQEKKSVAGLRTAVHEHLLAATETEHKFKAFCQRLPQDVAASLDYQEVRKEVASGKILLDAQRGGTWGHVAHALCIADITGRPVEIHSFDVADKDVKTYRFVPQALEKSDVQGHQEDASVVIEQHKSDDSEPIRLVYNGMTHFDAAIAK